LVAEELSSHESALRKLPLPYSLALRLRDAGVAPEMVSEYLGVDEAALAGIYRIAEAKLSSVQGQLQEAAQTSAEVRRHRRVDGVSYRGGTPMQYGGLTVEDRDGADDTSTCAHEEETSDDLTARIARLLEYRFPH
jgi:hypothetical protein